MMVLKLLGPAWLTWPIVVGLLTWAVYLVVRHWPDVLQRSRWLSRAGLIVLVALMCLRPSIAGGSAETGMRDFNVFFVVDTSTSMSAEDYDGAKQRLEGVKDDIKELVTQMAGARFSVITFNSVSNPEVPLTTDATAIDGIADSLIVQQIYAANGSDISQPLELLTSQLAAAKKQHPERANLVYFMSDGEQTADKPVRSFGGLKPDVAGGAVLGYGTSQGGKMKDVFIYGHDSDEYIKDKTSSEDPAPDALSKLDEHNLEAIAGQLGTKYVHRQAPGDVKQLAEKIGVTQLARSHTQTDIRSSTEISWVLAVVVTLLLAREYMRLWPAYRAMRRQWRKSP